jgi:radical SAM protein with 4Fe4S-binding SPASM domain
MTDTYRPYYCVWELTLRCNLSCIHCGSVAGRARPDELTTAEALDVVHQLADLGCRLISLSGGEPTLRSDWEEIARTASRRGIVVNMVTNGTTMTADLARRMASAGLANVGLSLDGPEAVHDAIRGRGTFRRVISALGHLSAAGLPTAVMTTLDRSNAELLEVVHDLAAGFGASTWRLQLGKPMGRLAEHRRRLIRPQDLLAVMPTLMRLRRRSPIEVAVGDSLGYFGKVEPWLGRRSWTGDPAPWSGCQAGRRAIGIESDGGVKGCLSLQAGLEGHEGHGDPFREGDLRSRDLEAIWLDPDAFAFNRRPERLDGFCASCEHAAICRGGAKCVAAAFTGRLGDNPYCYHRVSQLARTARPSRLRRHVAAAAIALGLGGGLVGCDSRAVSTDGAVGGPGVEAGMQADGGPGQDGTVQPDTFVLPPDAQLKPDTVDPCASVCCMCDYGIIPPELWEKCCAD